MDATADAQQVAVDLLTELVRIPSLSGEEQEASAWLVEQMRRLGYDRAYVDAAGNAVGEMGEIAAPHVVVLLGHIDTVPGAIPVRIEECGASRVLYGRGAVDAKGPLATFTAAAARLDSAWLRRSGLRVAVVGAVEEEAATSKGARFIRDRFDGRAEPIPAACIIGEPSGWRRVTLGYKGRLLVEMSARRPMAHTAGPDAGIATLAVALWNWLDAYARRYNDGRPQAFDQFQPSLRQVNTAIDAAMHDTLVAQAGIRLPLGFDAGSFAGEVLDWAANAIGAELPALPADVNLLAKSVRLDGPDVQAELTFRGYERAWRSPRDTGLVRAFLAAIRERGGGERPGFVVKTGTSDMNVVAPVWQCPILAYGPGDSTLDHTPAERIDLDEYWRSTLVLEQALINLGEMMPLSP